MEPGGTFCLSETAAGNSQEVAPRDSEEVLGKLSKACVKNHCGLKCRKSDWPHVGSR